MGYSITPIVKGTKANFRQKWSTEAINDIESAKRWWNGYPNDNIAIITGKRSKNLLIIDVDRKNSEDGTKAIKEWESQHDKLPKTLMATTPNNGLHYYYFIGDDLLEEADKYIKNKSKYYEGIDVRYNGGLIVAPPSTTKKGEYKWKNKGIPIAYANENVIDFLKNGVVNKTNNTFSGDAVDKKINNNLGKTKGVTVVCGNRNTSLASYIGSLHAQGYSDNTICKMAYIYNSENCIDNEGNSNPLPIDEVERTLKSILSRPKGFLKLNSTEENIKQFLFKLKPEINYSWDDKGNGKLFSDIFINTFRYNKEAKMWYFYNGKYWDKDVESITAKKYAIYLSRALEAYSFYMEEGERKEEYQKFLKGLGKIITRENMVKDAMKYSAISYADLDKNKNLFNCLNGTYDLENYTFRPHQAEDLISKVSNVVYDPNAKSEIWDKFINDIMINDDEKIAYIQRILGYALTASTKEETAFILYGSTTRNGKSTLIETYAFLLGGSLGYGSFAQPETLAQTKRDSRAPSEDLASLRGA
ncbi:bifunctional DNA primase/polymerase, partial [Thomasclavelia cocleata]